MSITSAMSSAVLGLRAAGRGAEVISSNISNALTPGYGRRVLELTSSSLGGVQVSGITRIVDAGLASDRRLADAAQGNADLSAKFFEQVERLLGTPDDPSSLSARLAGFESDLVTAASRPDAIERLTAAVASADGLIEGLRAASAGVQDARTQADRTIAAQVDELNLALEQVQTLNVQIAATQGQNGDTSGLRDQRQQIIDRIGALVPVREIARDNGQVALYSTGGSALVDGPASTIGFEPVNLVTPYMSVGAGTLSGLTVNDQPIRTDSERGALRGGALGAQFTIRDELAPAAQTEIDALARDLVERFQDPAVDSTLAPGDAGLFTDAGAAFDPLNEVGLAGRLTLNSAVDPAQGGQAWRMRDGINAATQGPVGDASLLHNLSDALSGPHAPASGAFAGNAQSASNLISGMISSVGSERTNADQRVSYAAARLNELTQLQLAEGVDTDDELQRLIKVEQAYAANARMIEVLDEMMQILNRL